MRADAAITGTDAPSSAARNASASARAPFPKLAVLAAVVVALALRIPGLLQDPWLDEIWSWGLVRSRASAGAVLTIESSNSHALQSLWMWALGDRPTFLLYRLPSLVAGVACVPLAARIAWRASPSAAIAAAWLVAVSYLAIVYASEARGYALMTACALATCECAWTWLDGGRRSALLGATVAAVVGVLAQTLFVVAWAAIAVAVVVRIRRERRDGALRAIAVFAAPPVVAFGAWWLVNVRHVFNAGAPPWDLGAVLAQTAAWSFGFPESAALAAIGGAIALAILADDARRLRARGDAQWIASVAVVVAGSIATVVILRDEYLAPRYFLAPLAFWTLAFARVLGRLADSGARGRMLAVALFALFAAGNALHLVPFVRVGRGPIGAVVRDAVAQAATERVVFSGNYDFNVNALLDWHARSLPPGRRVAYVPQRAAGSDPPAYVVIDAPRMDGDPAARLVLAARPYVLFAVARHAGPSGSDWAVYRRAD